MLSDTAIMTCLTIGKLRINPLEAGHNQIQPSSVDLRLGFDFLTFNTHQRVCIDPMEDNTDLHQKISLSSASDEFVLHPGEFVLAATLETVGLPDDLVGSVNGKSSLGRLGLLIHATAGFIDPGFSGNITLELSNVAELPIKLRPMMRIAQVSFAQLDQPALRPYGHPDLGSKYQNQSGVEASRYHQNKP